MFVCGPSGAGKDSVMNWAIKQLGGRHGIVFSKRLITREQHQGSDHEQVSPQQFSKLMQTGALAWHWQAHGFHYGISAQYATQVAAGRVVVVNGSREHCQHLQGHPQVRILHITSAAQMLAERLRQRGRDSPHEVNLRLARNAQFASWQADYTLVNQGELAQAGLEFVNYLSTVCFN